MVVEEKPEEKHVRHLSFIATWSKIKTLWFHLFKVHLFEFKARFKVSIFIRELLRATPSTLFYSFTPTSSLRLPAPGARSAGASWWNNLSFSSRPCSYFQILSVPACVPHPGDFCLYNLSQKECQELLACYCNITVGGLVSCPTTKGWAELCFI